MKTKVSSKGQVVIPKAYRQKLGWEAGMELEVNEEGGQLILTKPNTLRKKTVPLSAAVGLLNRPGKKVISLEDMESAIVKEGKLFKF